MVSNQFTTGFHRSANTIVVVDSLELDQCKSKDSMPEFAHGVDLLYQLGRRTCVRKRLVLLAETYRSY